VFVRARLSQTVLDLPFGRPVKSEIFLIRPKPLLSSFYAFWAALSAVTDNFLEPIFRRLFDSEISAFK